MRISDWSSDVCSSDLKLALIPMVDPVGADEEKILAVLAADHRIAAAHHPGKQRHALVARGRAGHRRKHERPEIPGAEHLRLDFPAAIGGIGAQPFQFAVLVLRSEEHTSELQSLMRISYAVFCLKKKKKTKQ